MGLLANVSVGCRMIREKEINPKADSSPRAQASRSAVRGRRLAWIRIHAWGACDPGFKSQRPHHDNLGPYLYRVSLAFSEDFGVVKLVDVFKSCLD